jgi:hypothetical protein
LKQVPDEIMPSIDMLRIHPVELTHALRKICFDRFDQQMVVIGHLAKAMDNAVVAFTHFRKNLQPNPAIGFIAIDGVTPVTARRHMVQRTGKVESEWSCHPATLPDTGYLALRLHSIQEAREDIDEGRGRVQMSDLTPALIRPRPSSCPNVRPDPGFGCSLIQFKRPLTPPML